MNKFICTGFLRIFNFGQASHYTTAQIHALPPELHIIIIMIFDCDLFCYCSWCTRFIKKLIITDVSVKIIVLFTSISYYILSTVHACRLFDENIVQKLKTNFLSTIACKLYLDRIIIILLYERELIAGREKIS